MSLGLLKQAPLVSLDMFLGPLTGSLSLFRHVPWSLKTGSLGLLRHVPCSRKVLKASDNITGTRIMRY